MKNPNGVALITGGSRGVGRAIAVALAERDYAIAIVHRNSAEQAKETLAMVHAVSGTGLTIQADVADDDACRAMVAEATESLGPVEILINNAATTEFIPHHDLDAVSTALWDRIFAVNVRGPFQCIRAAQASLASTGKGQVINISSIAGLSGKGSSIPYCASKAAVINLTQSMARTLAPAIRVNAVAPGFIDSQWTREGLGASYGDAEASHREGAALKTVAQPTDVADAVLGLLFGSRLVTGQTVVVDGGALLGA